MVMRGVAMGGAFFRTEMKVASGAVGMREVMIAPVTIFRRVTIMT
jgi:hypothetical protein